MSPKPGDAGQRILAAASKLFYADGIRAVGVERIAAEAGVTKRTLYYHYKSKDALVTAYLEAQDAPVLATLIKSITRSPGPIEDQIGSLFSSLADRSQNPTWNGCPFARAVSELANQDPATVSPIASQHKASVESWLEERLANHQIANPTLLSRQIIMLLDGAIIHLLIHGDPAYAIAAGQAAVTLIGGHKSHRHRK